MGNTRHKMLLDDMTVIFWAMNTGDSYADMIQAMFYGQSDQMDAGQTEEMLKELFRDAGKGKISEERLELSGRINPDVDFYMAGLKPNSSRLALKFLYRKKYGEVLWNLAKFQKDFQISSAFHTVSLYRIKEALKVPKIKGDTVNSALMAKLFEAALYGGKYPVSLLETVVRRVKTDKLITEVRAGIIKACINRNFAKEEFDVSLNQENLEPAYLCGRLFAVLEKLQQDASNNSLNRTIKDAYFGSACSNPAIVFPKLLRLAQNHLKKVKNPVFYNIQIGEIMDKLPGSFPNSLPLVKQGTFVIGYYQQYQSFFVKKEKSENKETEE